MNERVVTVLGPIDPLEMGLTDAHNHLWISPLIDSVNGLPVLDQFEPIKRELQAYRQAGGGSQIDCQPGGAGRDGNRLRQLAQETKVNIVACTGFHLREYYQREAEIWQFDRQRAAEYFLSELRDGLTETRQADHAVHPGFIKIAVRESLGQSPLQLIEAAVSVSMQTGFAIEMHTQKGSAVEAFVDHLLNLGLSLSRLVICHVDKRPDLALHTELAQAGCMLEYDTFFRPKYAPEENLWHLIPAMIEAGWQHSIALATDLADHKLWQTMGDGPGLLGFPQHVRQRLEKLISDQEIVESLMGKNITRRLALKT